MTPRDLLIDAIVKCKADIRIAVQAALNEFETRTGLTPLRVDIEMIDGTTYGDQLRRMMVSDVRLDLVKL